MRLITRDLITREECLTLEEMYLYIAEEPLQFYVYFLVDPFSFQIKYIGKGQGHRLGHHDSEKEDPKAFNKRKKNWLKKVANKNREPLYVIWEFYPSDKEALQEENKLIYAMGRKNLDKGGTLLNIQYDLKLNEGWGLEVFLEKALAVHPEGQYCYSNSNYKGYHYPINYECNKCHKIATQTPAEHLSGKGCYNRCWIKPRLSLEDFKLKLDVRIIEQFTILTYEGTRSPMKLEHKASKDIVTVARASYLYDLVKVRKYFK